jgi:hypothetical protein
LPATFVLAAPTFLNLSPPSTLLLVYTLLDFGFLSKTLSLSYPSGFSFPAFFG